MRLECKKWCKDSKKLTRCRAKRRFLLRCRTHDVRPPHISSLLNNVSNISIYDKSIRKEIDLLVSDFKTKLLNLEIKDCCIEIKDLEKTGKNTLSTLQNSVPRSFDNSLIHKQDLFNNHYNSILKHKHEIKFKKCTPNSIIPETFFNDNWFINMSNINIPREIVQDVALGLKFNTPTETIDKKTAFECIKSTEQFLIYNKINDELANDIRCSMNDTLNSKHNVTRHIPIQERQLINNINKTKVFFKKNVDLMFTMADKGNVTVALNKSEYLRKMDTLFSDVTTYKKIKKSPLKDLQGKVY